MAKKKPYKPPYTPKGKQNLDDPLAMARLEAFNARVAAENAAASGRRTAAQPVMLGTMAAAGGQFQDASAAPGYQNPETGQYSGMLQRSVMRPLEQNVTSARIGERLINKPMSLAALRLLKKKKGTYSSATGATTPTTTGSVGQIL